MGTDFKVEGTATVATFTFDATAVPTWTLLISSNGKENLTGLVAIGATVDSSGMWTVYQASSGAAVTKIAAAATALPTSTTATLNLTALSAALPSGKTFPWMAGRVYSLCVYPALGFDVLASTITPVCGTYHTMTDAISSSLSLVDRNMGSWSQSFTATGGSGNSYNMTIYNSPYVSGTTSTLNFGVVFYSTGTSNFEMWSALGINNVRMVQQDMFLLGKSNTIVDGYSTGRSSSAVMPDSAISCTNNAVRITAGKSITSGNNYQYWHGSRLYATGDSSCDTDITNSTQLCNAFLEGTTIGDLTGFHGSTIRCGSIILFQHMLVPAILAVVTATLI